MMKKILLILLLFVATNVNAQKTYNILEMRLSSLKKPNWEKTANTPMTINVSDSLFTITAEGNTFSYQIVKKVNENYFTISDGLQEYIITIGEAKFKNYSGCISQELEEGLLSYYF